MNVHLSAPTEPYSALHGLVKGEGELCYAVRNAAGKLIPTGCRKVSVVYDTGAAKSILHPKVAPEALFPRGPAEPVRGAGRSRYPTTIAFLRTSVCVRALIGPWLSPDPPEAFDVDVVVGDDYMEVANVLVSPSRRAAGCSASKR